MRSARVKEQRIMNRYRNAAALVSVIFLGAAGPAVTAEHGGLWAGSAVIDKVNEVNASDPGSPTPAATPLELVVLLHVDPETGGTRLLKEVYQMWRNGVAASGGAPAVPGTQVLLVDEALLPSFTGVALSDGTPVGRRISAVGFDFPGRYVACGGSFAFSQPVTCAFTLPKDHPTNPYLHRYHPDHDNLAEDGITPLPEVPDVARGVVFTFDGPTAGGAPEYGSTLLTGTYRETLTGLVRPGSPVLLEGTFTLRRVSPLALTEVAP